MSRRSKAMVHLEGAPEGSLLRPFYEWAREWFDAAAQEVAGKNGGRLGALDSAVLSSAAASLAWERYLLTRAAAEAENGGIGLAKCALSFGDSARKSIAQLSQNGRNAHVGFVDPLAEAEPVADAIAEDRARRLQRDMKKALERTDRKLQAEPSWREEPPIDIDDIFG